MTRTPVFKSMLGVVLAVAVFCVSTCFYAKWRAHRVRKDAERLILELHSLRVRQSTLDDVKTIAAHHGDYRRSFLKPEPVACKDGDKDEVCYFDFSYENSLLATLRLASTVRFGVSVKIYQRRVDAIMMDLLCGVEPSLFGIVINEGLQPFTGRTAEISAFSNSPSVTWVRLTPNAPERDRAYSLSLECFDHIGRCRSQGELLPTMANEVAVQ
jgi:hypothetical protein